MYEGAARFGISWLSRELAAFAVVVDVSPKTVGKRVDVHRT